MEGFVAAVARGGVFEKCYLVVWKLDFEVTVLVRLKEVWSTGYGVYELSGG